MTELYCAIAGCGAPAYTVYHGLMLCELCTDAAYELPPAIVAVPVDMEAVLTEFAMPNCIPDNWEYMDVTARVRLALAECGFADAEQQVAARVAAAAPKDGRV